MVLDAQALHMISELEASNRAFEKIPRPLLNGGATDHAPKMNHSLEKNTGKHYPTVVEPRHAIRAKVPEDVEHLEGSNRGVVLSRARERRPDTPEEVDCAEDVNSEEDIHHEEGRADRTE